MDNELSVGDGPQAYVRLAIDKCVDALDAIRDAVERRSGQSHELIDGLWLPPTYDYLAREAATASDVASHMPADRMLQYRIAYEVVPNMNRLAERSFPIRHLSALREPAARSKRRRSWPR